MLKINGVQIPTPYKFDVTLYDLDSSAERTASGVVVRDRVRSNVYKVELAFRGLNETEYTQLINAITPAQFTFEFPDPITLQNKTITTYAGDKKLNAYTYDSVRKVVSYKDVAFNLIEF